MMVHCAACKRSLPTDAFAESQLNPKRGRQHRCRECFHRYYLANKATAMERTKAYRATEEGKRRGRELQREARRTAPIQRMLQEARARAAKRGLAFDISVADLRMPDACPVLGIPLFHGDSHRCDNSPSLDRIDQSLGYVTGNVAIISWRANRLKSDATLDEMEAIIRYVKGNGVNSRSPTAVAMTFANHWKEQQ